MKAIATKSLVLAALIAAPLMASAQLSTNVSLASNYKFRGQDQVWTKTAAIKPALQGGVDYAFSNGLYVGNWNSSINFGDDASLEVDVYGGYKGEFNGVGYDVGLLKYAYPAAAVNNTTEAYLGLSYGPLSAKYFTTVSDQYFAMGTKAGYLSISYAQELSQGLTLKLAAGHTNFKTGTDFSDYSVGATYDLGEGYSVTGAMVGGTKASEILSNGIQVNKNRFILTFTKAM